MKTSVAALAIVTISVSMHAGAGLPTDIVLRPLPQAYMDTCQSYGMALAAASVSGSPLLASNAKELRSTERQLRQARDELAKKAGTSSLSHAIWKQAIERVSGNQLTLEIKYFQDFESWVDNVGKVTDVTNAGTLGPLLSSAVVASPVLTSLTVLGKNKYNGGHIVTVMGLDKGRISPPPIAVLNPAVKVGPNPEKITCELDEGPGDAKYQAFASIEKTYTLKKFDAGYVLLVVRKK